MALSRFILPYSDIGSGIKPSDGAQLFFYETGTSDFKDTFTDASGTIPNANPVIANSSGVFGDIFITGTYKVVLQNKNDSQIWEADPVSSVSSSEYINQNFTRFGTLSSFVNDASLEEGVAARVTDRGDAIFDVALASSVTPNTFNIVQCVGDPALALVLRITGGNHHLDQYGVVNDFNGTTGTDNTLVLITAFDAANSEGGGVIHGNANGRYRTTYTVFYGSNTTFDGHGCEVYHDSNTTNGSLFMPVTFQSYVDFTYDVIFKNFWLNGPVTAGNGIAGCRAQRILLDNVNSEYLFWHVFDGAGSREIIIQNCKILSARTAPFQADNASYDAASEASDINATVLPIAFDATGGDTGWSNCRDMAVTKCDIRSCDYAAVHIHNTNNQNITVTDNHIEDCLRAVGSDSLHSQIGLVIANNHCINNDVPIDLQSTHTDVSITGNRFFGTGFDVAYFYGIRAEAISAPQTSNGLAIVGNVFNGIVRPVIVDTYRGLTIDSNAFHRCGLNYPANRGQVTTANPSSVLRVAGCSSFSVSGNSFYDCKGSVTMSLDAGNTSLELCRFGDVSGNTTRTTSPLLSAHDSGDIRFSNNAYGTGMAIDFVGVYLGSGISNCLVDGNIISNASGDGIAVENGAIRVVVSGNVLSSGVSTESAILINNANDCRTSDNSVLFGYNASKILITGTSANALVDEPYTTAAIGGAASATAVTYTTAAL